MHRSRLLAMIIIMALPGITLAKREREAHELYMHTHDIKFSSYVDGSYNYLVRSPYFTSGYLDRVNDLARNGIRLQMLYLSLSSYTEGFGGFINPVVGLDAYGLAPDGWNPNMFNLQNVGLTVVEAYGQYRHHDYTIKVGEQSALAGLESYNYKEDTNFSRGILNGAAQPGSHIGLRCIHRLTDTIGVIVGVGNGWNTIRNPQQMNTLEAAISYLIDDSFLLNINGYIGSEYLTDEINVGPQGTRLLLDIFGTWKPIKPLTLGWNLDYGYQSKAALPFAVISRAAWAGIAGYVNYKFNDHWRSSTRAEIFNDSDGYRTGVRQNWKEVTLTLAYSPIKPLEVSAEVRHDFSNVNSFINKNGINSNNNQQSYAIAALYNFV